MCILCETKAATKAITDIPEVAKKIRLENTFKRELRPVFSNILRDFQTSVKAFGRAPDADMYKPSFNALMQTQFSRVQRAFRDDVVNNNGGKAFLLSLTKQNEDQVQALLELSLLEWRNENAENQADLITATNERQMQEAIEVARQDLQEREEDITPTALAIAAGVILRRRFFIRTNTIAQTSTQEAAESTKLISAQANSGKRPFNMGAGFEVPTEDELEVTKEWDTVGDDRVRPTHMAVNGVAIEENGIFSVGASRMYFPGDTSLAAQAKEIINCLHPDTKLNFSTPNALTRHWYEGEMITVATRSGNKITVTPNHPILTTRGWVGASKLKHGDSVVCARSIGKIVTSFMNVKNVVPTIEQIYGSINQARDSMRVCASRVNFHGDIPKQDVDIKFIDNSLRSDIVSKIFDPFLHLTLPSADLTQGNSLCVGLLDKPIVRFKPPFNRFISSGSKLLPFFKSRICHSLAHRFRSISCFVTRVFNNFFGGASNYSIFNRYCINGHSANVIGDNTFRDIAVFPQVSSLFVVLGVGFSNIHKNSIQNALSFSRNFFDFCRGYAVKVHLDNIVSVHSFAYSGYVYNLEDEKEYYVADNIVNHNCRCSSKYEFRAGSF